MDTNALHILLMLGFYRSNKRIVQHITKEGLMPGQPKILECLRLHEGCSQKEIAEECILDKSTVTSLLKRMEKAGYIRKEPKPDDQRSISIFLTPLGKEKAALARAVMYHIDDDMWKGISEEDKSQFIRTFHRIIENQKEWEM